MKPIIATLWVLFAFACTGISPANAPPTYDLQELVHKVRVRWLAEQKRFANAVAYMGEAMAMDALNRDRLSKDLALAYPPEEFEVVRKAWGVGEA